jgi:hypothetical protein
MFMTLTLFVTFLTIPISHDQSLMRPYANPALYQMDVSALSYIYAAYGKSGLISNGKE